MYSTLTKLKKQSNWFIEVDDHYIVHNGIYKEVVVKKFYGKRHEFKRIQDKGIFKQDKFQYDIDKKEFTVNGYTFKVNSYDKKITTIAKGDTYMYSPRLNGALATPEKMFYHLYKGLHYDFTDSHNINSVSYNYKSFDYTVSTDKERKRHEITNRYDRNTDELFKGQFVSDTVFIGRYIKPSKSVYKEGKMVKENGIWKLNGVGKLVCFVHRPDHMVINQTNVLDGNPFYSLEEGTFKNDKLVGKGSKTSGGYIFRGEFDNGKVSFGTASHRDFEYKGEISGLNLHGKGVLTSNYLSCSGDFEEDYFKNGTLSRGRYKLKGKFNFKISCLSEISDKDVFKSFIEGEIKIDGCTFTKESRDFDFMTLLEIKGVRSDGMKGTFSFIMETGEIHASGNCEIKTKTGYIKGYFNDDKLVDGEKKVGNFLYKGVFDENEYLEKGMISHENGHTFWGTFKDEKLDGEGYFIDSDGVRYEGSFCDGKKEGMFTISQEGHTRETYFENGIEIDPDKLWKGRKIVNNEQIREFAPELLSKMRKMWYAPNMPGFVGEVEKNGGLENYEKMRNSLLGSLIKRIEELESKYISIENDDNNGLG